MISLQKNPMFLKSGVLTWPLFVIGSIFLVWEAPFHYARVRRIGRAENKYSKNNFLDITGPIGSSWPTKFADAILIAILIFLGVEILPFIVEFDQITHYFSGKQPNNIAVAFEIIACLAILALIFRLFQQCWKSNRASGMRPLRAFLVLLLEIPLVGLAFREAMGVRGGVNVCCTRCNSWKKVWMDTCPHCHGCGSNGRIENRSEKRTPIASVMFPKHDSEAVMFRVVLPLMGVVLITVIHL
jgi:hypothetical protein